MELSPLPESASLERADDHHSTLLERARETREAIIKRFGAQAIGTLTQLFNDSGLAQTTPRVGNEGIFRGEGMTTPQNAQLIRELASQCRTPNRRLHPQETDLVETYLRCMLELDA